MPVLGSEPARFVHWRLNLLHSWRLRARAHGGRGVFAARLLPHLIGGGARSRLWSEIVANVFNCSVAVPVPGDASFGACLLAGVGIGVFSDVKSAVAKCLHVDRTIEPDPAASAKYDHLFTCYRRIHDALAPVYGPRKAPS